MAEPGLMCFGYKPFNRRFFTEKPLGEGYDYLDSRLTVITPQGALFL
jgi:hypothetical protein